MEFGRPTKDGFSTSVSSTVLSLLPVSFLFVSRLFEWDGEI